MCFKTKGSELKRAEMDIICYKEMQDIFKKANGEISFFRSYYQQFKYKPGVVYKDKSELNMKFLYYTNRDISKGGYHSYINHPPLYGYDIIVRCIIPKGSLYLENKTTGEYCSTAIKVTDLLWC